MRTTGCTTELFAVASEMLFSTDTFEGDFTNLIAELETVYGEEKAEGFASDVSEVQSTNGESDTSINNGEQTPRDAEQTELEGTEGELQVDLKFHDIFSPIDEKPRVESFDAFIEEMEADTTGSAKTARFRPIRSLACRRSRRCRSPQPCRCFWRGWAGWAWSACAAAGCADRTPEQGDRAGTGQGSAGP